MKKALLRCLFCALALLLLAVPLLAAELKIFYNDQHVQTKEPLLLVEGRSYVALRDVMSALGYRVAWHEAIRQAGVYKGDLAAAFRPGEAGYWLNGVKVEAPYTPLLYQDRLYLPVRALAQAFGLHLDYIQREATHVVFLYEPEAYPLLDLGGAVTLKGLDLIPWRKEIPPERWDARYELWKENNLTFWAGDDGLRYLFHNGENIIIGRSFGEKKEERELGLRPPLWPVAVVEKKDEKIYVSFADTTYRRELPYLGPGRIIEIRAGQTNTPSGQWQTFPSEEILYTVVLDRENNLLSAGESKRQGLVLKKKESWRTVPAAAWAADREGRYCFAVDDEIFITDSQGTIKGTFRHLGRVRHNALFAVGGRFLLFSLRERDDTLYLSAFHSQGYEQSGPDAFFTLTGRVALEVLDGSVVNDRVYLLVSGGGETYLLRYDPASGEKEYCRLPARLARSRFVPSFNGLALLAQEGQDYVSIPVR